LGGNICVFFNPTNKKVLNYTLTEKGISTIPLIVELMMFSMQHYPNQIKGKTVDKNRVSYNLTHASFEQAFIKDDKKEYLKYNKTLAA